MADEKEEKSKAQAFSTCFDQIGTFKNDIIKDADRRIQDEQRIRSEIVWTV